MYIFTLYPYITPLGCSGQYFLTFFCIIAKCHPSTSYYMIPPNWGRWGLRCFLQDIRSSVVSFRTVTHATSCHAGRLCSGSICGSYNWLESLKITKDRVNIHFHLYGAVISERTQVNRSSRLHLIYFDWFQFSVREEVVMSGSRQFFFIANQYALKKIILNVGIHYLPENRYDTKKKKKLLAPLQTCNAELQL